MITPGRRCFGWHRLRWLAATAVLALAAGCTAIPTGGSVHAGGPVDREPGAVPVRVPVQPPVEGESPIEIVRGFRQASSEWADLTVARAYLAQPTWQPDEGVRVIDESNPPSYTASGDRATVRFVDKWVGTIAPDGTYQPKKANETLDYTYQLAKESTSKDSSSKGEWRLANPPPYLITTANALGDYEQGYLYFFSPRDQLLVPVRVFLRVTTKDKATALIYQLLQGPPKWLAQAGVTSAIPRGTTVLGVTESQPDGAVTINLSAELAGLSGAERDAASAQLIYTLQRFGSGQFQIEAAGTPLPNSHSVTLQTKKTWSAYDPDALNAGPFYYVGMDGRSRGADGFPIPGDAGSGKVNLLTPVFAPRQANASGPELLAGVVSNGPKQDLYVGPIEQPKLVDSGISFTTPSWDAFGNVWTVRQSSANSPQEVRVSAVTQAGATKFITVANPDLAASDLIESLKISRDGTRVAVIAKSTTSGLQLLVGHVVKTSTGASIDGFYPVAPSLVPVPDGVVWANSTTLDVLATAPGESSPSVWSVDVDGWRQIPVATPYDDIVSIAAAPNQPLVIATKDNQIEVLRNDAWQVVGSGQSPSYPG
jgi:hypothetical protein